MFKGSWVALVTPYLPDNTIDQEALGKLVEWHIDQGTHGLVVGGSTGEGILLSIDEHFLILKKCLEASKGRIPVVVGASAIQLKDSLKLAQQAQEAGAAGLLFMAPAYVKPTQEAIINLVTTLHDQTDLPLIIYNNPARCGVNLNVETIIKLTSLSRVSCLKEANGRVTQISEIKRQVPKTFTQLCGEDALNAAFLAEGGDGWISVTANVAPKLCARLYQAWVQQDLKQFAYIRDALNPLHRALFVETSPSPIKYALSQRGFCHSKVRLPLLEATSLAREAVDQALLFMDQHMQQQAS